MSKQSLTIPLSTGTLHLALQAGKVPLHRLLGFAARVNSKRKFLLVSKVLGKHYPVTPLLMRWSYRALARQVLAQQALGTSLWIGMAETATGLGYGVYESAYNEGLRQALFMQTTRYVLSGEQRLFFTEAHSHATDFFLYYPNTAEKQQLFLNAETLVLIDDEISTGRTFSHLIQAYKAVNPKLKQVFIVSLVNFASAENRALVAEESNIKVAWLSLRQGTLAFDETAHNETEPTATSADSKQDCKRHLCAWQGRLGMSQPIRFPDDIAIQAKKQFVSFASDTRPILVLGTGECNAPAYLLGRALENAGYRVKVQSTTRSPIRAGGAIESVSRFTDNYEDDIANYLYNLNPTHYREIILCHETPLNAPLLARCAEWQAISAQFQLSTEQADYAELCFSRPR
jgi:hypothetical protein